MKVNRRHPHRSHPKHLVQVQGLLQAVGEGNRLTLEWYAPGQVSRNGRSFAGTGAPYKTVSYERSSDQGVQVLDIAEQREGMPVFRTQRRTEGNKVTTIQGEGEERTVRTVEKNVLPGGKWEMIESIQGINEEMPFSCMRTVKKYTDGGWLTVSSTRGYNTPLAQTTLYTYNDQFRVSLEIKPDGGYTRYEYDEQGRVVLQASPWAGGGEKGTRTTYADLRFNDFRPATQTEVVIAEDGAETELSKRTYTYEKTTQHGALHKVTETVQANGSIVPGQSTRSVQYIAENGTTTRKEQYVHTGEDWSLIASEDYEYDDEQRLVKTTKGNGRTSTTEWMCCGPLRETDEDGITTSYGYNSAKQLVETIRAATETTPETIISYTKDAAGRTVAVRRDVGLMTTVERTQYDDLGRVVSSTDILGRITRTEYSEDGLTTTVTTPAGATLVTHTYYDGTTILQSGTGQREMETRLELTPEGILTTSLSKGVVLSRTLENGFGQTVREETPNTQGRFIVTRNTYNGKRQLVRSQTENLAPTLTDYNELGQAVKQTVLLDELRPNDTARNRISETSSCYRLREDSVYQVQTPPTTPTMPTDSLSLRLWRAWFPSLIPFWKARPFSRTSTDSRASSGRSILLLPHGPSSAAFPLSTC